jgi:hypothetical protein
VGCCPCCCDLIAPVRRRRERRQIPAPPSDHILGVTATTTRPRWQRDHLVHSLGNLTLVNGRLNPTLSNPPWADDETGSRGAGKRAYLLRHSQLALNAEIVAGHEASWTETDIARRTDQIIRRMSTIRARPASVMEPPAALPAVEATETSEGLEEAEEASTHTGKYRALHDWLRRQPEDLLPMSFDDVETSSGWPCRRRREHISRTGTPRGYGSRPGDPRRRLEGARRQPHRRASRVRARGLIDDRSISHIGLLHGDDVHRSATPTKSSGLRMYSRAEWP